MRTAYLEAQGGMLRMKVRRQDASTNGGGGIRGKVQSFSAASRRRMIHLFVRMKAHGIRATFLTVTFAGKYTERYEKVVLNRFFQILRRKYPNVSGVWRMEFQEKGRIHFHLLLFKLPYIKQAKLQRTWERCTGEVLSVVDVRLVRGHKAVVAYVCKYVSKLPDEGEAPSLEDDTYLNAPGKIDPGRYWGYLNKNALPFGEREEGVLLNEDGIEHVRRLTMFLSRGKGGKSVFSTHLFTTNACRLFHALISIHGLEMDDYKNSSFCPNWEEMNTELYIRHFSALNQ